MANRNKVLETVAAGVILGATAAVVFPAAFVGGLIGVGLHYLSRDNDDGDA